jgi:hypothetical protein
LALVEEEALVWELEWAWASASALQLVSAWELQSEWVWASRSQSVSVLGQPLVSGSQLKWLRSVSVAEALLLAQKPELVLGQVSGIPSAAA